MLCHLKIWNRNQTLISDHECTIYSFKKIKNRETYINNLSPCCCCTRQTMCQSKKKVQRNKFMFLGWCQSSSLDNPQKSQTVCWLVNQTFADILNWMENIQIYKIYPIYKKKINMYTIFWTFFLQILVKQPMYASSLRYSFLIFA